MLYLNKILQFCGGVGGEGGLLHYTFPVMLAFPFYLSLLSVFASLTLGQRGGDIGLE